MHARHAQQVGVSALLPRLHLSLSQSAYVCGAEVALQQSNEQLLDLAQAAMPILDILDDLGITDNHQIAALADAVDSAQNPPADARDDSLADGIGSDCGEHASQDFGALSDPEMAALSDCMASTEAEADGLIDDEQQTDSQSAASEQASIASVADHSTELQPAAVRAAPQADQADTFSFYPPAEHDPPCHPSCISLAETAAPEIGQQHGLEPEQGAHEVVGDTFGCHMVQNKAAADTQAAAAAGTQALAEEFLFPDTDVLPSPGFPPDPAQGLATSAASPPSQPASLPTAVPAQPASPCIMSQAPHVACQQPPPNALKGSRSRGLVLDMSFLQSQPQQGEQETEPLSLPSPPVSPRAAPSPGLSPDSPDADSIACDGTPSAASCPADTPDLLQLEHPTSQPLPWQQSDHLQHAEPAGADMLPLTITHSVAPAAQNLHNPSCLAKVCEHHCHVQMPWPHPQKFDEWI